MGNDSIVKDTYLWLWKTVTRGMWKLGFGKLWMKNFIDKL